MYRITQLEKEVDAEKEEREMGRGREGMLTVENEGLRSRLSILEEREEENTERLQLKESEARVYEALQIVEEREVRNDNVGLRAWDQTFLSLLF
jgi:hypothetical protein